MDELKKQQMIEKVRKIIRVAESTAEPGYREACEARVLTICQLYEIHLDDLKEDEPENYIIRTGTKLWKRMGMYTALQLFEDKVYRVPTWRLNRYGERVPSYEVNAFQFMATYADYRLWYDCTEWHTVIVQYRINQMKKAMDSFVVGYTREMFSILRNGKGKPRQVSEEEYKAYEEGMKAARAKKLDNPDPNGNPAAIEK